MGVRAGRLLDEAAGGDASAHRGRQVGSTVAKIILPWLILTLLLSQVVFWTISSERQYALHSAQSWSLVDGYWPSTPTTIYKGEVFRSSDLAAVIKKDPALQVDAWVASFKRLVSLIACGLLLSPMMFIQKEIYRLYGLAIRRDEMLKGTEVVRPNDFVRMIQETEAERPLLYKDAPAHYYIGTKD